MPSTATRHNLLDLRVAALMFSHEIYSDGAAIPDHWGNTLDTQLNEGVRQMWSDSKGIQSDGSFQTNPGVPNYPLSAEFLYMEKVACNGRPLVPANQKDIQLGATNTSTPQAYVIRKGGPPASGGLIPYLWLAPYPPDAIYTISYFYRRSPREMVAETDCPELPLQWQLAPAYWAAFMLGIADANPAGNTVAQVFAAMKREMAEWIRNNSLDQHPVTGTHGSSWDY